MQVDRRNQDFKARARAVPYDKRDRPIGPSKDEGKWEHDLFDPLSTLYNPKPSWHPPASYIQLSSHASYPVLNVTRSTGLSNPVALKSSESLESYPLTVITSTTPSQSTPPTISLLERLKQSTSQPQSKPKLLSLAARLGVGPSVKTQELGTAPSPISTHSKSSPDPERFHRIQIQALSQVTTPMKLDNKLDNIERQIAVRVEREGPVNVRIEHLVEGTTAEDVKTAFQDFGTILSCSVEPARNQELNAIVIFKLKVDADVAVSRLDGAVADGRKLRVYTTTLGVSSPFHPLHPNHPEAKARKITEPHNQELHNNRMDLDNDEEEEPKISSKGKMYSDLVGQNDAKAPVLFEPFQIQQRVPVVTQKPRSLLDRITT